jgi:hypothetical protein
MFKRPLLQKRIRNFIVFLLIVATRASATPPAWWLEQGVVAQSANPEDFAAANLGQLKNIAVAAYAHMSATLPPSMSLVGDDTANGPRMKLRRMIEAWVKLDPDERILRDGLGKPLIQDDATKIVGQPLDFAAVTQSQLKAVAKPFYDRLSDRVKRKLDLPMDIR